MKVFTPLGSNSFPLELTLIEGMTKMKNTCNRLVSLEGVEEYGILFFITTFTIFPIFQLFIIS